MGHHRNFKNAMGNKSKFEILSYQNYLAMIKASQNSEMFRHFYILNQGKKKDILKNGCLSCARYVSCILKIFGLISETHATVSSTVKDMINSGWRETVKLVPGSILLWEEQIQSNGDLHEHLGFYLGKDKAISHRDEKRLPIIHHYTYGKTKNDKPKRKIVKIFTHSMIK